MVTVQQDQQPPRGVQPTRAPQRNGKPLANPGVGVRQETFHHSPIQGAFHLSQSSGEDPGIAVLDQNFGVHGRMGQMFEDEREQPGFVPP
jgi:hypothetical protein